MIVTANILGSTGQSFGFMTVELDGDITTASDENSLRVAGNDSVRASASAFITTTPGSHTFTAVYRQQGSGTVVFSARNLIVIPG